MDQLAIARALHVLAVVLWIGGVGFVTTVLLPAVRRLTRLRQLVWIYTIFGAVLGSNALFLCRRGVEKGL